LIFQRINIPEGTLFAKRFANEAMIVLAIPKYFINFMIFVFILLVVDFLKNNL